MLRFIGACAVLWFMFHYGIAQALLLWIAALGTIIFG